MLERNVVDGVHRIEDAFTNWYLVEGDGGLTIVDAGVPSSWKSLDSALDDLGRSRHDLRALVLTHAHFDHIGFAERARRELGLPVHVHTNDVPLTRHPLPLRPRPLAALLPADAPESRARGRDLRREPRVLAEADRTRRAARGRRRAAGSRRAADRPDTAATFWATSRSSSATATR